MPLLLMVVLSSSVNMEHVLTYILENDVYC